MQKITTFFWFNNQAEEAAKFYTSIFKNSKIGNVARYTEVGQEHHGQKPGTAMTVPFTLDGIDFIALNGGPVFQFSQATSFVINCETQAEVDHFWDNLSAGGQVQQCGWLIDKFGIAWQVTPSIMGKLLQGDPEKSKRAMAAMFTMVKIDIQKLQDAYDGK
jgi:predicted 3-demethylubiquinone-9 3-methyltransferase (glyoxalase superfamily)